MTQTPSNARIARRGVAAALAALLGAGVFSLSAPAAAADGRYYRMPDGSVQYVRDRDLPDWRRWQDRRWRDDDRHGVGATTVTPTARAATAVNWAMGAGATTRRATAASWVTAVATGASTTVTGSAQHRATGADTSTRPTAAEARQPSSILFR